MDCLDYYHYPSGSWTMDLREMAIYTIMDSLAWLTLSLQLIHSGDARRLFRRITTYSSATWEELYPDFPRGSQSAAALGMTLAITYSRKETIQSMRVLRQGMILRAIPPQCLGIKVFATRTAVLIHFVLM